MLLQIAHLSHLSPGPSYRRTLRLMVATCVVLSPIQLWASESEASCDRVTIAKRIHQLGFQPLIDELTDCLSTVRKRGDKTEELYFQSLMSSILLDNGLPDKAHHHALLADDLVPSTQDAQLKAIAKNVLGDVEKNLAKEAMAAQSYAKAFEYAELSSNTQLQLDVLLSQLALMVDSGHDYDYGFAPSYAKAQALTDAVATENQLIDGVRLANVGVEWLEKGYGTSDQSLIQRLSLNKLVKLLDLARGANDQRAESMILGLLAALYQQQNRLNEAEKLYNQAIFAAHEIHLLPMVSHWNARLGQLYVKANNADAAIAAFGRSVDSFVLGGQSRVTGLTPESPHLALSQLLLAKANNANSAENQQQYLRQIRELMESLRVVELREYFQDSCLVQDDQKSNAINIDALVTAGTGILYPVIFEQETLLLLTLPNGKIVSTSTAISQSQLTHRVHQFRSMMNPSTNPRQLRNLSIALYQALIDPIATEIEANQLHSLVIVPGGVLRSLPFSALHDGKQYLAERLAIAIAPSLTLTEIDQQPLSSNKMFVGGLSESVQGFPGLRFVKPEVATISSLENNRTLLDQQFTKPKISNELAAGGFNWVSLSTHASIDRHFKQSYLLTFDGKMSFDEMEALFQRSRLRQQPVDLLVLSACETAVGDDKAAMGLAGLAVKAGVRTAMASLWTVNDQFTSELVPFFLQQIKQGNLTKAQALQAAQQKLLSTKGAQHPYYWAGFVIVGNWL